MGLEKQFIESTRYEYQEYAGAHPSTWEMDKDQSVACAEIAENFAIGFAEWCNRNYGLDRTTWVKYVDGKFNRYTTKELLEIYKKTL